MFIANELFDFTYPEDLLTGIEELRYELAPRCRAFSYDDTLQKIASSLPPGIRDRAAECVRAVIQHELTLPTLDALDYALATETERKRAYQRLKEIEWFLDRSDGILSEIAHTFTRAFSFLRLQNISDSPTPFQVSLMDAQPAPRGALAYFQEVFTDHTHLAHGILRHTSLQIRRNTIIASGYEPSKVSYLRHSHFDLPFGHTDYLFILKKSPVAEGYTSETALEIFFNGTPFYDFFHSPVYISLPKAKRFEHTLVLAPPGQGKTSLLERLLLHDFQDPSSPSVVLLEPHADLTRHILEADSGISDRVIYISPRESPAINLFDFGSRIKSYSQIDREQFINSALTTLVYAFSGILDTELTGRQRIFFEYCVRAMFAFPEVNGRPATIRDLLDLLQKEVPTWFDAVVSRLSPVQQQFFRSDFHTSFKDTKEQMRYRLFGLLGDETFQRLFTSEENRVDFYELLNSGSIILIEASEGYLQDKTGAYGRIFISLILQAVMARFPIEEKYRKSTFFYIDEAHMFFSEDIASLLREARKFKCGVILALQDLAKCTPDLFAAMQSSTATKFAGGSTDAGKLAREMRADAQWVAQIPPLSFAYFMRGEMDGPLTVKVEPGLFEKLPRLPKERYDAMLARSRKQISQTYLDARNVYAFAAEPSTPFERPEDDIEPE